MAGRIGLVLGEVSRGLGKTEAARAFLRTAQQQFAAAGASVWERRAEEALGALVG